jgi:integrase
MARRGDGIYLRGRTWWLDFWHDGKRHQLRLGKGINRAAAGELAAVKRAQVLKGEAGIGRKRKDLPFEKAAEEFRKWADANKRPKTAKHYRSCLGRLERAFAGKSLGELHPFLIEKYRRGRLEAGARVTSNRELAVLRALFNRSLEWGKFEGENPASKVKPVKEPRGRLRYLEPEEEAKLLAAAGEPLRTIVLVGIHAGLRIQSEALTLRQADVDLRRGLLTVQAAYAKSGQTRSVPLNSLLREALGRRRMQDGTGEHVFRRRDGRPYRSIVTAFATARKRAGLGKDVTPHVLRHTFASRLVMAGVDLRTAMELGGWSSLDMVQRYAHLSPSHKAEAVERLAAKAPESGQNSPTLFPTPLRVVAVNP